MKIAVPVTENENIAEYFGHSENFLIYSLTSENKIEDKELIVTNTGSSCGCSSNVGPILASLGVEVILAGDTAAGVMNALEYSGIKTIRGCYGNATEIVQLYLNNDIVDNPKANKHHPVGANHSCSN